MEINEIVEKAAAENKTNQENSTGAPNQEQKTEGAAESTESKEQQGTGSENTENAGTENKDTKDQAAPQPEKEDKFAALFKKHGVSSVEELDEKLSGKKELTKEEQEKADEEREANLQKFAVEKGKMKLDDFNQLKTLKSKADAELVFEKYLADFKEENPDITEDVEKVAKAEFEKEYKLNHDNESVKNRGVGKLAKEAAEIRGPLENSYNEVKKEFEEEAELRETFPKFVQGVEKIANEVVPVNVDWYNGKDGEEEVKIEIPLPDTDRAEILEKVTKRLQSPETYGLFKEGKLDELKERISEYVEYLVNKKTKDIGTAKIAEMFLGRGMDKGSNVGAENKFETNQSKAGAHSKDSPSQAEKEKGILNQFGNK